MFLRYVAESIRRAPRRKAMTVAAVAMGTAVATSLLGVMLDIGDKVNLELRSMGANILVTPKARAAAVNLGGVSATPVSAESFIPEAQVPRIKSIFWALNVTGFAPSLTVSTPYGPVRGVWFNHLYRVPGGAREERAGVRLMNPAWKVEGRWVEEDGVPGEALAGAGLHLAVGHTIEIGGRPFHVVGVLKTGAEEDGELLVRLGDLQAATGRQGQVDSIQVAALTKPEDDFARKDPARMSPAEREKWSCSPYVRSIAYQIDGVLSMAAAKPVWRVADSEGRVLSKVNGLMLLIALAALAAAGLTVWSVMASTVMERRAEIAIMQAAGATDFLISGLFAAEVAIEGFAGGLAGVLIGLQAAGWVGRSVFGGEIRAPLILAPLAVAIAILVAVAGAIPPLRRSLAMSPAVVLRERC